MGARSGLALKFLQWFIRGIQFCCSALILSLFSYFLAALNNHNITIPTWARAVEGISGVGVVYTLVALLLLCCLAGHPATAVIAMALDVAFIGAYIYVAVSNRGGADDCNGTPTTIFGQGPSAEYPKSNKDGFTNLPTFYTACRMHSACLAVAIAAIIFFIFSILVEVVLVRHRRKEQRFGPSPANNYTSGYGGKSRFIGLFKKRQPPVEDPNTLPEHTTPAALSADQVRPSYNTDATAVGNDHYNKYESGYGHSHDGRTAYPEPGVAAQHNQSGPQPASYRYNDGTYNV